MVVWPSLLNRETCAHARWQVPALIISLNSEYAHSRAVDDDDEEEGDGGTCDKYDLMWQLLSGIWSSCDKYAVDFGRVKTENINIAL